MRDAPKKPFWYLVKVEGRYRHTQYTPEQTAQVRAGQHAGLSLDAIAAVTQIPYSSLAYVAALDHLSRRLTQEGPTRGEES